MKTTDLSLPMMSTQEASYYPASTTSDPPMTISDYHYAIATPHMFPPGLPTPASGPYSQLEFPSNAFMTPETTLGEFSAPCTTQEAHLGLNISAVQPFESLLPTRPHSSPSTFGPNEQDIVWAGVPYHHQTYRADEGHHGQHFVPSHSQGYSLATEQAPRHRYSLSSASNSDIKTPQPRRPYAAIAPNPVGIVKLQPLKRSHADASDDETCSEGQQKRQRRSPPPINVASPDLNDEDRLLLRLKDEEHISWKDVAARFQAELGKVYQVPALQMRMKRLRERLRVWTEPDVSALRMAHEYWERSKFEIIATKMLEFGATEKWSARQCSRKWQEMNAGVDIYAMQSVPTPAFSYTSSPIEAPTPSFVPPTLVGMPPHSLLHHSHHSAHPSVTSM